jgi:2-hydroxy-3-keto-5-methylthiopentenyl-1-phosphate phosphatase
MLSNLATICGSSAYSPRSIITLAASPLKDLCTAEPELKHQCQYERENFKSFDELRIALRKLERDFQSDTKTETIK